MANLYACPAQVRRRRGDEQEAGEIAGAGGAAGNPDVLYNQGVILFSGGKPAEAKPIFEQVIAWRATPGAHYMLGMTVVGENPP